METLTRKEAIRILEDTEQRSTCRASATSSGSAAALLVQEPDRSPRTATDEGRTGEADASAVGRPALRLEGLQARKINAIVLAQGRATVGIGAGQMSRVDSSRIAVEKAHEHGHELAGAVLASDAFFPFADGAPGRDRGGVHSDHPARRLQAATTR